MKKVSVIIPAYNCGRLIGQTISSILAQTYSNFELLIVDDGSTDNTKAVIQSFDDERIKYFYQDNHGGPSRARNKGIEESTGEYIFIFDSDDLMRIEKIELSVKAMEDNPGADILFTRFALVDEGNKILREDYLKEYLTLSNLIKTQNIDGNAYYIKANELLPAVVKSNFIGTSSVMLRSSVLAEPDKFDESLKNADDRLFWIRFSANHDGIFLNAILHDYRVVNSGITGQGMLKKGPNKISALEKAKLYCSDKDLIGLLDKEIANNYLAMARESKNKKDKKIQRLYAINSIHHCPSFKAIKLFISSWL